MIPPWPTSLRNCDFVFMSASPPGQCPPRARVSTLHHARREATNAACSQSARTPPAERACRIRFSALDLRKVDSRAVDCEIVGSRAVEFGAAVGLCRFFDFHLARKQLRLLFLFLFLQMNYLSPPQSEDSKADRPHQLRKCAGRPPQTCVHPPQLCGRPVEIV